jgi:methylenetetrahydromethanopterin dehydrogenase
MKLTTKSDIKVKKVGILKFGNIASSVMLDMLLDERADRDDIEVKTISSGAKLTSKSIKSAYEIFSKQTFDLSIIATPNASLKAPLGIIQELAKNVKHVIVLTDVVKKETIELLKESKIGYLIVKPDAMIGARREFLDPVEMAIFNSDLIKVLAIGGVFNILYQEIDRVLNQITQKKEVKLPYMTITPKKAVKYANFDNPYAAAKAQAALEIAQAAAKVNTDGCFKINKRLEYIPQVATGHEMIQAAAALAEAAREIEKSNNKVQRKPHHYKGEIQKKRLLKEKPTSDY